MDYKMEINYLKKEMLVYELNVRGILVNDSKTVDELRSTLRPLLKLERQGKLNIPEYSLDPKVEFNYVSSQLKEIHASASTFVGENAKTKLERFQSRLVHLSRRIDRIPVQKLSSEEIQQRSELLVEALSLFDSLESLIRSDPNLSILFETSRADDGHATSTPSRVQHNSNPATIPSHPTTSSANSNLINNVITKFEPVRKWGIKFSGDPKQLTVHAFLERVEELKLARRVTDDEIFDSATDLLSGKALNWYRSNRTRLSSWKEFADLLKRHFEPPDYRSRLFREILERTQDPSEGIVDYMSTMAALFRRYGHVPEDAQLEIISRNLAPFYTTQLPIVNSLEELENQCLKLEAKKYRAEHYVPPPRRRLNLVEPDFAFIETSVPTETAVHAVGGVTNSVPPVPNQTRFSSVPNTAVEAVGDAISGTNRKPVTCWNCRGQGHLNRDCNQPRKIHCFKCGNANVTIRNCPKCSVSGNESRGSPNQA